MGSRRGGIGVEDGKGVVGGMPSFSSTLPGAQTAYVDHLPMLSLFDFMILILLSDFSCLFSCWI